MWLQSKRSWAHLIPLVNRIIYPVVSAISALLVWGQFGGSFWILVGRAEVSVLVGPRVLHHCGQADGARHTSVSTPRGSATRTTQLELEN